MCSTLVHRDFGGRWTAGAATMWCMASDQQTTAEAVVEFGAPEPAARGRRRWSATEIIVGLGSDRRTVPLAAAVGAVALFASLISEWQVAPLRSNQAPTQIGR